MKKHLLGTSAIVAASLGMASAAMAQTSAPVVTSASSSAIQLTINGFIGQYFGAVGQDDVGTSAFGANPNDSTCINCARLATTDLLTDSRFQFRGVANLMEGLTVGMLIEIPGTQAGSANYSHIRETQVYVQTGFGRLTIGNPTSSGRALVGASYSTGNAFPGGVPGSSAAPTDVLLRNGMVSGGHMHSLFVNPTGSNGTNSTINGENGDMYHDGQTQKIVYLSPRIFGFQAGASWAPELSRDFVGTGEVISKEGGRATYRNAIGLGVNYAADWGGVGVAAGVGYSTFLDAPEKSAIGTGGGFINDGSDRNRVPRPEQLQAGLAVFYAGFKIGAGWGVIDDARTVQTSLTEFTGSQAFRTSVANSSLVKLEGQAWSVGGSYTFGPAAISLNYTKAWNNDCPTDIAAATLSCSGVDKFSAIGLSGNYQLGPGVTVGLGGFYGKYRGNNYNNGSIVIPSSNLTSTSATNASQNNEGGGVIGGILVRF